MTKTFRTTALRLFAAAPIAAALLLSGATDPSARAQGGTINYFTPNLTNVPWRGGNDTLNYSVTGGGTGQCAIYVAGNGFPVETGVPCQNSSTVNHFGAYFPQNTSTSDQVYQPELCVGSTCSSEFCAGADSTCQSTSVTVDAPEWATGTASSIDQTDSSDPVNTSGFGDTVQFTFTASSGSGPPTGNIEFDVNNSGEPNCLSVSLTNGAASCTVNDLAIGSDAVTMTLSPTGYHDCSTCTAALTETVTAATTATSLSTSAVDGQETYGQTPAVTASVSSHAGTPSDGSVIINAGSQNLGSSTLIDGQATITLPVLAASGSAYDITASYQPSGSSDYAGSTSQGLSLTVVQAPLKLTSDSTTTAYRQPVPLIGWTAAGFVGGDSASSLTKQPACSAAVNTDRAGDVTSPANWYATTCSGAVDTNYYITYRAGELGVTLAATTTRYDGPTSLIAGGRANLTVSLLSGKTAVSGRKLTITLGSGAAKQFCTTKVTDSKGNASCSITHIRSSAGKVPLLVVFRGDSPGSQYDYAASSMTMTVHVRRGHMLSVRTGHVTRLAGDREAQREDDGSCARRRAGQDGG